MKVIQFLALQEPRLTARLAQASAALDAVVVLDLEDALWDVTDESRTAGLKAEGRRSLLALARDRRDLFARQRMGVRLNRWSSPESILDLAAIAEASRTVEFDTLVVTKVETELDLTEWVAALRRHGVAYRSLVPIVETRAGIDNLEAIAQGALRAGIEWLVYGHWDFALDSGWWPVPDHDHVVFWRHVEPLIERIEGLGLGYVHPPSFQLADMVRFGSILSRLRATCRREFGILTIGTPQTTFASTSPRSDTRGGEWLLPADEPETATEHATRIVRTFTANKRPNLSFAVDVPRREFISPHIFLAARDYLARAAGG